MVLLGLGVGSPPSAACLLLERAFRASAASSAAACTGTTTVACLGGSSSCSGTSSPSLLTTCMGDGAASARLVAPVTGRVASPPRPGISRGTGSLELCVAAKKGGRKRRRRPRPGQGGGCDDNWGMGGDNGGGGGGDDDHSDGGDWGPEPDPAGGSPLNLLLMWNLLCFCSFLQCAHFAACRTFGARGANSLLSLTNAMFGSAHKRTYVTA
mmetsp:Transcript_18807/g.52433  ORF Transcript_18807/g.52433 Transcript_18807/m.52433 type:complete len:211 (-) Transcript_18807:436-1068(-)|eukprot:CAMPEP_0117663560 /NCGR_PEP_ID=MMETSP0804-20121206/8686_1 /TAXON_ID=1074897 /ORGANISM="Tetraselmis astigmatica, Strain CCMP880" /LENGTH=210 /DNA_ID=CAMNT_0005470603 /DNA_START=169 /DNA_END=801 /DNA_ORIENTATION=+